MSSGSVFARIAKPCTVQHVSKRVNSIKISPIKEMELLAAEMEGVVSLGQGTPSFQTPIHIREFVKECISRGVTDKYSLGPGIVPLRQAIAAKLTAKNKIPADSLSEILVTVGANEALSMATLAIIDPGDEVLVTTPSYSPHLEQIKLAGGIPVFVPLLEESDWELDLNALNDAVTTRTKAVIVSSPVNPTGSFLTEKTLRHIADVALRNNLFVIADETYEDFVYEGEHFSIGSIEEVKDLVLSIFSFSKSYAMTGWRCGYVHAPAGMINQLLKIHDALCICTPLTAQYAGLAALNGPQDCIVEFRKQLLRRRDLVMSRTRDLVRFRCTVPQGAYYLLPRVEGIDDPLDYCLALLREQKVVLVPGGAFGPTANCHVRISYCMSEEVINEAFDKIAHFEADRKGSSRARAS